MRRKSRRLVCSNFLIVIILLSIFSNDARARIKFLKNLSIATGVAGNPERKLISCTIDSEERRDEEDKRREVRREERREEEKKDKDKNVSGLY